MRAFLFFAGLVTAVGQVLLLRELNAAFYGVELVYSAALVIWLAGTGTGAFAGPRTYLPPLKRVYPLLLLFTLLLAADTFVLRNLNRFAGETPGAFMPLISQFAFASVIVFPPCVLAGLVFQWLAKIYASSGGNLPDAYAFESLGGMAGGILFTLFIKAGIGCTAMLIILNLTVVSAAAWFILYGRGKYLVIAVSFVLCVFAGVNEGSIENVLSFPAADDLSKTIDTPYSRIRINRVDKQINLFEDNTLVYESASTAAEELVHLPALHSAKLNRALVLGGSCHGITGELIKYPGLKIDCVELDKAVFNTVLNELPQANSAAIKNSRVRVQFGDIRAALAAAGKYDIIISGAAEPLSGFTNRYYTIEFFRLAKSHLNTGGVFAFSLPAMENYWPRLLRARNSVIFSTLRAAFNSAQVLPAAGNVFIASESRLCDDYRILTRKFASFGLHPRLISESYIHYLYTNDRYAETLNMLSVENRIVNTNNNPVCYQLTASLWLSKLLPGSVSADLDFFNPLIMNRILIVMLIIALLLAIAGRKYEKVNRLAIIFAAGFQGMAVEIIVLLRFQTLNGILFQNIGVLLMSFMAGLAFGVWLITNGGGQKAFDSKPGIVKYTLLIFFAVYFSILYVYAFCADFYGIFPAAVLLVIAGSSTSAVFSLVSLRYRDEAVTSVSLFYGIDIIGGMCGAAAVNFLFIPFMGIGASVIVTAALCLPIINLK